MGFIKGTQVGVSAICLPLSATGRKAKTFFARRKSLEDVYHTRTVCVAGNKIMRRPNIAVATRALTHPNCIPPRVDDACDDLPGMLMEC